MALEEGFTVTPPLRKILRPGALWQLHHLGFKIVLIYPNRKTPVAWHLKPYEQPWTKEQFQAEIIDIVYGGKEEYSGIATCFGESHIKDPEDKTLYLNCVDIDSLPVFQGLENVIEWCRERTYVTRTYKSFGYHIYWLSHQPNPHVGKFHMRNRFDATFEIKTNDSLGLCHLPPSPHRDHADFQYYPVGRIDCIMVDDLFYARLLTALQSFLKPEFVWSPEIVEIIGEKNIKIPKPDPNVTPSYQYQSSGSGKGIILSRRNGILSKLPESGIPLSDEDIAGIVEILLPYIHRGSRDDFYFHINGYLHKSRVEYGSAKIIVEKLTEITHDEERRSRLATLKATYKKHPTEVCGSFQDLLNTLKSLSPSGGGGGTT